jgi:hypothetical protein
MVRDDDFDAARADVPALVGRVGQPNATTATTSSNSPSASSPKRS